MDGPRIITDAGAAARGLGSRTDLPPSAFDPPTGRWTRTARTTTGWAMRLAEALIGGRIRVTGLEDLDDGPLLFVANHFTRFETFILPYLIYLRTGRFVHSLAWHGLFRGLFGRYLLAMGARPTRDPAIRHRMVEDLMTGAHDWLIYPEGGMVKDKHLWKDGHLDLDLPDRHGPPHTGAAIMALKALFYRDGFLRAVAAGDRGLQARYQERYHLAGAGTVSTVPLRVVPVTITYWPLRPEANGLTWLARRLMKEVPAQLREELTVEGHLLLHRTDIAVHIGHPMPISHYTDLLHAAPAAEPGFPGEIARTATAIEALKHRLTRRMMHAVYQRLEISLDHLFCASLRLLSRDTIRRIDLHRAIYLAARTLRDTPGIRVHATLGGDLVDIVAGAPSPALDSVVRLACDEGILSIEDGAEQLYRINRIALERSHGFHDVRLDNMVAVIANELEPVRPAIRMLRTLVNQPGGVLARSLGRLLAREALAEAERERADGSTIAPSSAMPQILAAPGARVAVVLVHGYLASPGEVMGLAGHLRSRGMTVVVPRLAGHGSSPAALNASGRDGWLRSVRRALAQARALAPHVVLAGFSTGGLLALRTAGDCPQQVIGAVTLNASLRLRDHRASLAPLADAGNRLLARFGLPTLDLVANIPEWPDTNYDRNPVHALAELMRLIRSLRHDPPRLRAPAVLLQADRDDVVDPRSAGELAALLGRGARALMLPADHHVCLRGPGAGAVWERVAAGCAALADRLPDVPPRRFRTPLPRSA